MSWSGLSCSVEGCYDPTWHRNLARGRYSLREAMMGILNRLFGRKRSRALTGIQPPQLPESPEAWGARLQGEGDYRGLAAVFDSSDYAPVPDKWKREQIAARILVDAGPAAVEAIVAELAAGSAGCVDLARSLARIGDPRGVAPLKAMLDRDDFAGRDDSEIRHFVGRYPELHGAVEEASCAACGTARPVTQLQVYLVDGTRAGRRLWFCRGACWERRARVLSPGVGTDCPFYSAGMCRAGNGDALCSLGAGTYASDCAVYAVNRGGLHSQ